ncbi:hypothetical protein BMMON2_35960 [Burkholderia mallei]
MAIYVREGLPTLRNARLIRNVPWIRHDNANHPHVPPPLRPQRRERRRAVRRLVSRPSLRCRRPASRASRAAAAARPAVTA